MKNIKIIKRKTSDGEQNELPVAVQRQISNPAELQREMTTEITGWINDWRGRKLTDARTAFNDLFEISSI